MASSGPRSENLATVRGVASSLGIDAKNPKWTSHGALEIDFFAPSDGDLDLLMNALEPLFKVEFVKDLQAAPPYRSNQEVVNEARELFNSERYWECHEVLEGMWRNLKGEEKSYVQGFILVCAALVHHQKGEPEIAMGVLKRAVKQLSYHETEYLGIDTIAFKGLVEESMASKTLRPFRI